MLNTNEEQDLKSVIDFMALFENQKCIEIVSGIGTWVDLYFSFPDEGGIFIREAAWRLEKNGVCICSSASKVHGVIGDSNQTRLNLLGGLIGHDLLRVEVMSPIFDVTLYFEQNYVLKVFCQGSNNEDFHLNGGGNILKITANKTISKRV